MEAGPGLRKQQGVLIFGLRWPGRGVLGLCGQCVFQYKACWEGCQGPLKGQRGREGQGRGEACEWCAAGREARRDWHKGTHKGRPYRCRRGIGGCG